MGSMLLLIAIVLHLSLAAWFLYYLLTHDKGNREPTWALVVSCLLGIISIVLALIGNGAWADYYFGIAQQTHTLGDAWAGAWRVGVVEEVAKALPVGLFIFRRRFFNESTDGVIYFGLAALVFGTLENIMYSLSEGGETGIVRIFMTPFLHVALTAAFGYYVARWRLGLSAFWKAALVFIGAILVHAIYDASLLAMPTSAWLGLVSLTLSLSTTIGIFLIYAHAHKSDLTLGLATDGVRAFCRSCGRPNPQHDLYCSVCGKKA